MSLLKMIKGEPMPDKNDPKYRERYEREVEAGRKFAEKSGINWVAVKVTSWAMRHKVLFLALVFGTVLSCLAINIIGMVRHMKAENGRRQTTAVEMVDKALQESKHKNR